MRTSISSTFIFCSDCHGRCGTISSAPTSQFPRGSSRRVASDEKLEGLWTLTKIRSSTCCLQWVGPRWLCSKVVDELHTLVVMSSQPNGAATTIACPLVRLHVKVLYGQFKCHPCALDFSSCVRASYLPWITHRVGLTRSPPGPGLASSGPLCIGDTPLAASSQPSCRVQSVLSGSAFSYLAPRQASLLAPSSLVLLIPLNLMLHTESAARPDCRVSVRCFPPDKRPSHVSILESMFAVVSFLSKGECIISAQAS